MKHIVELLQQIEVQVFVAIVAFVAMSWPIFTADAPPAPTKLFVFGAWAVLIFLMFLSSRLNGEDTSEVDEREDGDV